MTSLLHFFKHHCRRYFTFICGAMFRSIFTRKQLQYQYFIMQHYIMSLIKCFGMNVNLYPPHVFLGSSLLYDRSRIERILALTFGPLCCQLFVVLIREFTGILLLLSLQVAMDKTIRSILQKHCVCCKTSMNVNSNKMKLSFFQGYMLNQELKFLEIFQSVLLIYSAFLCWPCNHILPMTTKSQKMILL